MGSRVLNIHTGYMSVRVVVLIKEFSANLRNEYLSLKELKTGFRFFNK